MCQTRTLATQKPLPQKILDRLEEAPGHAVNGGVGSIQADIAGDHDGAKLQK
jgi:hypothetical protein